MYYPTKRNLDGYYFRVERNGKWDSICFSDLTEDEMTSMLDNRSEEWLTSLCVGLARQLRYIGDELDIEYVYED